MEYILLLIVMHFVAFLLGSVPVGYLLGRHKGVDVRTQGSGNTGATNLGRVLGKKAGLLTLLGDVLKGVIAVCIPALASLLSATPIDSSFWSISTGTCAVYGHCFSPFLKFRGGKGVATSLGVFLLLSPIAALLSSGVFLFVAALSRYVSLASICAAFTLPIAAYFSDSSPHTAFLTTMSFLVSLLVVTRHHGNISRLLSKTESRLGTAKTES